MNFGRVVIVGLNGVFALFITIVVNIAMAFSNDIIMALALRLLQLLWLLLLYDDDDDNEHYDVVAATPAVTSAATFASTLAIIMCLVDHGQA